MTTQNDIDEVDRLVILTDARSGAIPQVEPPSPVELWIDTHPKTIVASALAAFVFIVVTVYLVAG